MRARLRALGAWYHKPENQRRVSIIIVIAGLRALEHVLRDNEQRLNELERATAGIACLEDVATLADVDRITAERLARMGPDGRVDDPRTERS